MTELLMTNDLKMCRGKSATPMFAWWVGENHRISVKRADLP